MRSLINIKQLIFDAAGLAYLFAAAALFWLPPTDAQAGSIVWIAQQFSIYTFFGLMAAALSQKMNWHSLGKQLFGRASVESSPSSIFKQTWFWQIVLLLILTFVVALRVTHFKLAELFDPDGAAGAWRLLRGISSPNLALLPRAITAIIETIFIAWLATVLAIPLSFVLCFLAAKNLAQDRIARIIYICLRTSLNVVRSVEALIWAIIASVWVGIGPFAGMLALFIHSVASLTKQYSEIVESIDEGPVEGILATGARPVQVIWFGIVPQVVLPFISFTIYRWDINVRMATIIGLVGGGGIGTLLIQYQGQAMWQEVGCIILVIAVVVWLMDTVSAHIREAIK